MRKIYRLLGAVCGASLLALQASAQNPFVQTWFTSDPAPMVHGDRVYVYTGHDEDNADFFWMQEWRVYSSADMVNWTDHGSPLALESFSWADDRAWASQCIERNGKFYWYICAHSRLSGGMAIGVAVADSPTGPFRDAIGKPLYENGSWDHIDPTVFIDEDGQAWLYWGNPRVYCVKLNEDMISLAGEVFNLEMTEEGFGAPDASKRDRTKKYKDTYTEGPWIMKKPQVADAKKGAKGYYLLYAAGGVPEHIAYSEAPSPTGPWTYKGTIMPEGGTGSFTNHCGYERFKGHDYFFYHTGKLPGGGGFGRSVAVEEFKFNPDGTFPTIQPTDKGVEPIGTLNPYERVEAETMAFSRGIKTAWSEETGVYVTSAHAGDPKHILNKAHGDDYIKVQAVNFGKKVPRTFTARVACALRGGAIEVRIDSLRGKTIARLEVPHTGGWEKWQEEVVDIRTPIAGVHDIYFVFRGRMGVQVCNFDWWQFRGIEECNMPLFTTKYTADPSPIVVGDTLFLYTSHDSHPEDIHDEKEKNSAGFFMYDWLLWSTTDMVNWTEHGAVASLRDFEWRSRENGAWAIQTVERNGKFYLYAPLHGHGIGVLVADSPYGPFKDPLGKPLVWQQEHWDDIDPSVFIDDDGQAWMFWGNPHAYCVKLNEDMISTSGDIYVLNQKDGMMRPVKEEGSKINLRVSWQEKSNWAIQHYQEGPWFYKRNGHYYMAFASTCCPEALGYAMSNNPLGPWKEMGYIMRPTERDRGNHPGIVDYKGNSYVFGQNYDIMHIDTWEHHERRSVSAKEITYNANGTIQEIPYWLDEDPMKQLHSLNPYKRVEAETMNWGYGLKTCKVGIKNTGIVKDMPYSPGRKNLYVTNIDEGEYIRVKGVDFGSAGAKKFLASIASAKGSGNIVLTIDGIEGKEIGRVAVKATGADEKFSTVNGKVENVKGVHDLYLHFENLNGTFNFDWWQFQ